MSILELKINNLRGIRQLELKPEGRNFLISGPNGSGKSAIVDAIDFLLTGDISCMKGKVTKGITLKKLGPHIDSEPKDIQVKAIVEVTGIKEPVEIRRSFKSPKKFIVDDDQLIQEALIEIVDVNNRYKFAAKSRKMLLNSLNLFFMYLS